MHIALSLPEKLASTWMDLFASAMPCATFDRHEPDAPVRPDTTRADYAIAAYESRTFFLEQPAPKAVFTTSAGVGHVFRMPNLPRVPIVRVEDAGMVEQMVRYAMTAAMRVAQQLDVYRAQQDTRTWRQRPLRSPADVRCGVMGLGVMGSAIARALVAEGFAVRGYARTGKSIGGVTCMSGPLSSFLAGLDLLVNVLPSTRETAGMLDRAALTQLADGAHVVNIGRGDILVDEDLVALIDSGKLGGATLDVFREEPLPPSHPFWTRRAITITPHVAGLTVPGLTVDQIVGKIEALERGERVTGIVDVTREY